MWAYAISNIKTWDNLLLLAEFTYNATACKVTRVARFEADLGYILYLPIDFLLIPTRNMTAGQEEAASFTAHIEARLHEICERLQAV